MTYRPQFKRYFHYEIVPSEGIFLLSEKENILLQGAPYLEVAPFLNGQHTEDEIIDLVPDWLSPPEVLYVIDQLKRKGYIVNATTSMPPEQAAFWDMLAIDPELAVNRLQETVVSVVAIGAVDPAPFKAILEAQGVCVGDDGQQWVVLTDDYLQDGLEAFNRAALRDKRPWLLVKPKGVDLWLGPLFIPAETGCWACLAHRLRRHRKVENYLQKQKNTTSPLTTALATLPSTQQTALEIATTEILKWVATGESETLKGQIVSLNTLSLEKQTHQLTRRPQCACCGDPTMLTTRQMAPLKLYPQPKSFTADGGHRGCSPEETVKKFEHHISPITGIISRMVSTAIEDDQGGLVTSYATDHNFVHMNEDLYFLRNTLRSLSGGKGKSDIQAKASALGESIERYSGVFQGDEARIRAKLKDLGAAAIHPNACMRYSERQFANRDQWNQMGDLFNWVPVPFDEDQEIEWSPVWSLTHNVVRYVPTAYCYYGYQGGNCAFTQADSNGCAAGNSKEEAILQGFMELVERDSVALWWYNRLKQPGVELDSFDEPYVQALQTFYRARQRDLWVLDISSDLDIPTFAAISRRNDREPENIVFGFGTHFDPHIALLRALTEHNQLFNVYGQMPTSSPQTSPAIDWYQTATIANQPYLTPDETVSLKTESDYPQTWSNDLYPDIRRCVQLASEKGLETLVLDQTRPDTGLHVVKVFVPGLYHFWARFAPGRLYDIPVQMGFLPEPLPEEDLNPIPIFI